MSTDISEHELLHDSLAWYQASSQHTLLTAEQEQALGRRAQAGDAEARNALVEHNLRLVWSVAKRYTAPHSRRRAMNLADLIQHGNLGLLKAADRFDPARGYRFSTYATYWIAQAIQRAIIDEGTVIRLPVHMAERLTTLSRVEWDLAAANGAHPSDAELAEALGWDPARVARARAARRMALCRSLDVEIHEGEGLYDPGLTLGDMVADPVDPFAAVDERETQDRVRGLLAACTPRECYILTLRYGLEGEPHTLEEVGRLLGITRERVRQVESEALKKLRELPSAQTILLAAA